MRKVLYLLAAGALLLFLALLLPGRGVAGPAAEGAAVRLQAATFNPTAGEEPALAPGLEIAGYAQGQRGYYLVQFQGPVQAAWKERVAATGAELLNYVPDFAFKVRMNPAQAQRVAQMDAVAWVGLFHPAYKLSPDLVWDGPSLYTVRVERGASAGQVRAAIARSGAEVLSHDGELLTVAADAAQLEAIARVLDVAWVENFRLPETHNEYGAGVIMNANLARNNGYDGSTQTVAVADTGFGGGTANSGHPDIAGSRVLAIYNWRGTDDSCWSIEDDGPVDVDSGHGTHVAASVASDGTNGVGTGTAPAVNLVFQATENWANMKGLCSLYYPSGYYLTGLPADLRQLFQQAYDAGARIHSNSWGSDAAGDYTADSAYADEFIWAHPDMLITFSAGNAGTDGNGDGEVDADSTGSPATAKNVLTVGASENDRQGDWACDTGLTYTDCAAQGGQNDIFTYGSAWPGDYPANPLASDPSAGNGQQMAAFSSRGPTDDGRIKPDVVAPGTWILSGYSDLYQQGYDNAPNPKNNAYQYDGYGFPYSQRYKYLSGTSMSNPLTAGAAAVVRDFYQKAYSHAASAALTKATLINSAVDLLDENNDGQNDNDYPIPNNHEGWGLVNVGAATDGSAEWVDEATGLNTGGSASYTFNVATSGTTFKVSLVWSDYPSTEAASRNLVNDLDLTVTGPGGAVYHGNVFGGGWSQSGGSADRTNNVENVYVQAAAAGSWTVEVGGYNVPNGAQPFALVVDGATAGTPEPTATNTPAPTATNTPEPTATSTPGPTATNTPQPTATSTPAPTNTPAPASSLHVADLDGSSGNNGKTWTAFVTIRVEDDTGTPVANATVSGSWSNGGTASCTTDGSGQCTVSQGGILKKDGSVTYTVTGVSHSTLSYDASANGDPDGDSNGTTITVSK